MMTAMVTTQPIRFKPVYCVCGRFLLRAAPGSWVEVKCPSCKRIITSQIAEE